MSIGIETESDDCCPKCGLPEMEFNGYQVADGYVYYPAICNNCGYEGEQVFNMVFKGWEEKQI